MTRLTEHTVLARTRAQDLKSVRKLNVWGSELTDVSIVKSLPNVEVLSLSVNSIGSLQDFAYCSHLQELYLRKNNITDLSELKHLQDLPKLRNLWLADNPCAEAKHYRFTVIRALPQLQKLDNIAIYPEELETAQLHGIQLDFIQNQVSSPSVTAPEMVQYENSFNAEVKVSMVSETTTTKSTMHQTGSIEIISPTTEEPINISTSCAEHVLPLNQNKEMEPIVEPASNPYYPSIADTQNSPKSYYNNSNEHKIAYEQESPVERHNDTVLSDRVSSSCSYTPAPKSSLRSDRVTAFKMLPKGGKNRNANILSAVLCLIKELDWPSLEVVDTAVHCLMEEVEAEQCTSPQGSGAY